MKKIMVRAGISPLDEFSPGKIIARNSFGGNVGNLIYQYGIFRTLTQKNIEVVPDYYGVERNSINAQNAREINKNYIAYVCPLADAFRQGFMENLKLYTKFIKKLSIPFIVAGIGIKISLVNRNKRTFPFDGEVTEFINEVNKTGTIVGVRGKITAKYLTKLGFKEDEDFMITGCPSMFSFGKHLKINDKKISKNSTISINSSLKSHKIVLKFISKSAIEFPNHYFIPQWLSEFRLTYFGQPLKRKTLFYPTNMDSEMYKNNYVRFPISAQGWIDFLKKVDLSFGARLHGNIAATLAGTPNIIVIKDGRMKEVADYHNLTRVTPKQLKRYKSLKDLIENVNFHSAEEKHEKLFNNYLKFWEKNGVKTAYSRNSNLKKIPLDEKLEAINIKTPVETIANLTNQEINKHWKDYKYERRKWIKERVKTILHNKIYNIKQRTDSLF